ncbi:MAG TPA: TetR/AcrR family transcriptional regulator [Kribbella sp.]|uniref:TetR/AcrR family transcriptional regulator n=1 Tax=Kribbella sp. TaxID=1871183 RepID=UPI002D766858|nr:TetR/AcrR family transcriptional regulator [Kribbella sp.]HET6298742.1 TetR/AcrR family transcriptional regulator [Kribbella sp.]
MSTRSAVGGAPLNSRTGRTTTAILDAAARVFSEHGSSANMADIAAAAGVGRATLYRHFPDREALLGALASHAIADSAARLADAGLERAPVAEAIERIVRAVTAIGDRYSVLAGEHVESDPDEVERLLAAPVRAVLTRGIESGLLRQDLPPDVLFELFRGALGAAIQLIRHGRLGVEEASAAAASVFLDGARAQSNPQLSAPG